MRESQAFFDLTFHYKGEMNKRFPKISFIDPAGAYKFLTFKIKYTEVDVDEVGN